MIQSHRLAFACVCLMMLAASAIYVVGRSLLANIGNVTTLQLCAMAAVIGSGIYVLLAGIVAIPKLLRM